MKDTNEIVKECLNGSMGVKMAADVFRVAAATLTAVYGPKGHKEGVRFAGVVDLDYHPRITRDGQLAVRVRSATGCRFKVLPVVAVDFTWWTYHGRTHRATAGSARIDAYSYAVEANDEVFDASGLGDEMQRVLEDTRIDDATNGQLERELKQINDETYELEYSFSRIG